MKKGDYIWGAALLSWVLVLVIPQTREAFMSFTGAHPYIGGFIKFIILATMGDLLGIRLIKGDYVIPGGIILKALVWGLIGMMSTLMFTLYMGGANAAQNAGLLPFAGVGIAQAFFGSAAMNLTFGPMMMFFHRIMDLWIDSSYEKTGNVSMSGLVDKIDWHSLVEFSWAKTCLFFWIPAHTIVFMLPPQYRVLVSAFLSIALGLLLAFAKKGKAVKSS